MPMGISLYIIHNIHGSISVLRNVFRRVCEIKKETIVEHKNKKC